MIRLKQAVVVEGKYDRAKLNSIFDAPIIETGGFNLYHNEETKSLIRSFAKQTGIIILTDSDPAGRKLRSYITELAGDGQVFQAFVPEIEGKEARKQHPGAAGILGVEGISEEILKKAVLQVADVEAQPTGEPVTVSEWYAAGLTGGADSKSKREYFLRSHGLPGDLSVKQALSYLNRVLDSEKHRMELAALEGSIDNTQKDL